MFKIVSKTDLSCLICCISSIMSISVQVVESVNNKRDTPHLIRFLDVIVNVVSVK